MRARTVMVWFGRGIALLVLVVVTALASSASAGDYMGAPVDSSGRNGRDGAGGQPNSGPPRPSDDRGTTQDQARGRGPTTGAREGEQNVGRCTLYANSSSFGEDCPASASAGRLTWRQILADDPFPRCKVTPLPPEIVPPVNPKGADGRWMLHTCLDNITVDGVVPGEELERRAELVFYPAGARVPVLTAAQQRVWAGLASSYPTPVVAFGPVQPPRVDLASRFWLVVGGDDRARTRREAVTTPTGRRLDTLVITTLAGQTNTPLRAYVTETLLWPGRSPTEAPVRCPGAGAALPTHTRPAAGQPCTYTYARSSAHLPDDMYNLTVEASWAVEYQNAAGTWVPLGQAPVTSVFRTPVHEIQTITVS